MLLSHMLMTCFHQWIDFRDNPQEIVVCTRNAGVSASTPVTFNFKVLLV